MASEVLLAQGMSIDISTLEALNVAVTPLPTMASLDCIGKDIQVQGGTAPEQDVTTLCSTAKEFRLGLQDPGSMSISGHWKQGHPGHAVIKAAAADKKTRLVVVTFNDNSTFKVLASVQQRSWSAAVDGVVTASYTLRLSGEAIETDPV